MLEFFTSSRLRCLGLLLCSVPLMAGSCDATIGVQPTVQHCAVTYDQNFPSSGHLQVSKPAECMFNVLGATRIPYAATVQLPAGSVNYGTFDMQTISRTGLTYSMMFNAVWSQGAYDYFVNITGDYWAATSGFGTDNTGWDDVVNRFYGPFGYTSATARLGYQWGAPENRIEAPETVASGTRYRVRMATTDPILVSPLTWTWHVNGAYAGTSSDEAPLMQIQAGTAGTEQLIESVATDVNGRTVSGSWTVRACYTELTC